MRIEDLPPHIRKAIAGVRTVTASSLGKVRRGPGGRNLCRWCLKEVSGRQINWCSDACVNKLLTLQNVPNTIYERDQGRCQLCRIDLILLQKSLKEPYELCIAANSMWRMHERKMRTRDQYEPIVEQLNQIAQKNPHWFRKPKEKNWEGPHLQLKYSQAYQIDHIIPVADGGTTTADNLRTLCVFCHEKQSALYAAERARRRKNGNDSKK